MWNPTIFIFQCPSPLFEYYSLQNPFSECSGMSSTQDSCDWFKEISTSPPIGERFCAQPEISPALTQHCGMFCHCDNRLEVICRMIREEDCKLIQSSVMQYAELHTCTPSLDILCHSECPLPFHAKLLNCHRVADPWGQAGCGNLGLNLEHRAIRRTLCCITPLH